MRKIGGKLTAILLSVCLAFPMSAMPEMGTMTAYAGVIGHGVSSHSSSSRSSSRSSGPGSSRSSGSSSRSSGSGRTFVYHHNTDGSTTNAKYRVRAGDTVVVGGKSYTVGRNASHGSSGGYGGSGGGGGYSHSSSESHGNHSGGSNSYSHTHNTSGNPTYTPLDNTQHTLHYHCSSHPSVETGTAKENHDWNGWVNSSNLAYMQRSCKKCGYTQYKLRQYWNNINVLNPNNGEDSDAGIFTVTAYTNNTKSGVGNAIGSTNIEHSPTVTATYDNQTNEPWSIAKNQVTIDGSKTNQIFHYNDKFTIKLIQPKHPYYYFDRIENVEGGTQYYNSATKNNTYTHIVRADNEAVNIYTRYARYTIKFDPNREDSLSPNYRQGTSYTDPNNKNIKGSVADTEVTETTAPITCTYNSSFTMPNGFYRSGYKFAGWSTEPDIWKRNADGTYVRDNKGNCVKDPKAVVFDADGAANEYLNEVVNTDHSVNGISESVITGPDGYTCENAVITLYAQWEPEDYHIYYTTYGTDNKTGDTSSLLDKIVNFFTGDKNKVTDTFNIQTPTFELPEFVRNKAYLAGFTGGTITNGDSIYNEPNKLTDAAGQVNNTSSPVVPMGTYGNIFFRADWNTEERPSDASVPNVLVAKSKQNEIKIGTVEKKKLLTAVFHGLDGSSLTGFYTKYDVSWKVFSGNSNTEHNIESKKLSWTDKTADSKDRSFPSYTRPGYTFNGWVEDETKQKYTKITNENIDKLEARTLNLYPQFTEKAITVRFDHNFDPNEVADGTKTTEREEDKVYNGKAGENLSSIVNGGNLPEYTRYLYTLVGFSTKRTKTDGTPTTKEDVDVTLSTVPVLTETNGSVDTVVYYAVWERNSVTINFETMGQRYVKGLHKVETEIVDKDTESTEETDTSDNGTTSDTTTSGSDENVAAIVETYEFSEDLSKTPHVTLFQIADADGDGFGTDNYAELGESIYGEDGTEKEFRGWAYTEEAAKSGNANAVQWNKDNGKFTYIQKSDSKYFANYGNFINNLIQEGKNNGTESVTLYAVFTNKTYRLYVYPYGYTHTVKVGEGSGVLTAAAGENGATKEVTYSETPSSPAVFNSAYQYQDTADIEAEKLFYIQQAYGEKIGNLPWASLVGYDFAGYERIVEETNEKGEKTGEAMWENVYNDTVMPQHDDFLYPKFLPHKYKVHFNTNAGSVTGEMADQEFTYDDVIANHDDNGNQIPIYLTQNTFARDGYKFTGWNTKKDGTGYAFTDHQQLRQNLTDKDGDVINLYAMWEKIDADNNLVPAEIIEPSWSKNSSYEIQPNTVLQKDPYLQSNVSWTGYAVIQVTIPRYIGVVDGKSDTYDVVTLENISSDAMVLYEKYDTNVHTIYYGFNTPVTGGGKTASLFTSIKARNFTSLNIGADSLLTVNVKGYLINKVYNIDFSLDDYQYAEYKTVNYAWEDALLRNEAADNERFVSFDANDIPDSEEEAENIIASGDMGMQKFAVGILTALTTNAFTRSGYTFTGWNTKADGTGTAYQDKQEITLLSSDNKITVLYAQWQKN